MRFALTEEAMRRAEERAVAERGRTLRELMEHAGTAVADEVSRRYPVGRVIVLVGGGNNGGDGWVTARVLHERGRDVLVVPASDSGRLKAEAADAFVGARAAGVSSAVFPDALGLGLAETLADAAVLVDALFGIGFRGEVREPYASVIAQLVDADAPVVAVDVPSGVNADSGGADGPFVRADVTVTFSAPKPGLLVEPGRSAAGEIVVAKVGVPDDILAAEADVELFDPGDLALLLPQPLPSDHKGSRGRILIVAGSARFTGAAVLAATGALRMGAGYVRVAAPQAVVDVVHAALPSAIATPLPSSADGSLSIAAAEEILHLAANADALAIGPGLTHAEGVAGCVRRVLAGCLLPAVVDADALNVFAGEARSLTSRRAPTLITPHPGELARVLGETTSEVAGDRLCYATKVVGEQLACLLKGPGTVVATEGRRAVIEVGGAGLAKAGSGDVLTGMLATLLGQGLPPYEAAVLGAHLHGRAGAIGGEVLTETCVLPTDLPAYLPAAVRELT